MCVSQCLASRNLGNLVTHAVLKSAGAKKTNTTKLNALESNNILTSTVHSISTKATQTVTRKTANRVRAIGK